MGEFWYFGIILFFTLLSMVFHFKVLFPFYTEKWLLFIDVFIPVYFIQKDRMENSSGVRFIRAPQLLDRGSDVVKMKSTIRIMASLPSAWVTSYSIFTSNQHQSIKIYISFAFSIASFSLVVIEKFEKKDFFKCSVAFCDAMSTAILWAIFSNFTNPYGSWAFPLALGVILNVFFSLPSEFLQGKSCYDQITTIILFGIGGVFGNFYSPFIYIWEDEKNFVIMIVLKMIGLFFLINFDVIVLAINEPWRKQLFSFVINEVFIIGAIIGAGIYLLILMSALLKKI